MEGMVISMNRKSVLNAIAGGIIVASVTTGLFLKYRSFRQLKENIDSIPYDLKKPFKWQHFFKQY